MLKVSIILFFLFYYNIFGTGYGSQTVVFAPQGVFCPNTAVPPWAAAI